MSTVRLCSLVFVIGVCLTPIVEMYAGDVCTHVEKDCHYWDHTDPQAGGTCCVGSGAKTGDDCIGMETKNVFQDDEYCGTLVKIINKVCSQTKYPEGCGGRKSIPGCDTEDCT